MSFMPQPGGPPPGLPMDPSMGAPPLGGAPPMMGGDPLSAGVAQQQGIEMVKSGAMMVLAQMLGDQASPEAVGAQSSPGPMAAPGLGPQ